MTTHMRHLKSLPLLAVLMLLPTTLHAAKKAPPALEVDAYPAKETHAQEHVTIAADPFDTRARADFFRLDYVGHSFLPIRVLIRNDSDKALSLTDVRIQLITADKEKIPAAIPDEINRRLFRTKDVGAKKVPGLPITYHKTPVDKKITQDDDDFGLRGTTVEPHSTLSGFLFYDVKDVDDPILKGAELYVKEIKVRDSKQELFGFSIPFDNYLASKKSAAPASQPEKK